MKLLLAVNPQPPAPKLTLVYGTFVKLRPDHDGKFRVTETQLKQILREPDPNVRCRCGCFRHY